MKLNDAKCKIVLPASKFKRIHLHPMSQLSALVIYGIKTSLKNHLSKTKFERSKGP